MDKLSVLHIVPWYPNPENEIEAIFISKHIEALSEHCQNTVLHIQFGEERNTFHNNEKGIELNRITLKPLINKWRIKELLATNKIRKYLSEYNQRFDIVNFYVAYPNATKIGVFKKKYPNLKFVITELWSAYHEGFNLPENNKGRKRIAAIFSHDTPLFVVSNALGADIQKFAGLPELSYEVIPNLTDTTVFQYQPKKNQEQFTFSSINNWSTLKNPILLLDAFSIVHQGNPTTKLILAGSGHLDESISNHINALGLAKAVEFKGRISKNEVVSILQASHAYCQSSNYETFSAICIEALSCGTPVIATNIGGMKDFITERNGYLVDEMTAPAWADKMNLMMKEYEKFNLETISKEISQKYNAKVVGQLFFNALKK